MKPSLLEIYKCSLLTVIALLLGGILWHLTQRPQTVFVKGGTIDYIDGGSLSVDGVVDVNVENDPLDVSIMQ
jgi:hypothetical protein